MKRGRVFTAGVAAIVLGLTLTAATSATAATPAQAMPGHAAEPRVVVVNCLDRAQVDPRSFVLACADGNSALSGMSWATWTPALASATGTLVQNDCIPYCAAGHFHSYPVLVVLWHRMRWGGEQRFGELTMIFTGARPSVFNGHKWVPVPRSLTDSLWAPVK